MDTIVPSFLIGSSLNLQVTRAAIKSRTNSNSGHVILLTSELPAFECRKQCCGHDRAFRFDHLILPVKKDRPSSLLETQNDINFGLVKTCVKP